MRPEEEFSLLRRRMVAEQLAARGIHDPLVLTAMGKVRRHCFVKQADLPWAYSDEALPIGYGQTISQPYIVAVMTELLAVQPGNRVLEVGSGSGYQAGVLGELAAEVHTVEVIPELARKAGETLAALGYDHVHVHMGDGSPGWPEEAPYDRILVAAATPEAPRPLLEQLIEGGQLVAPVGGRSVQRLELWKRVGEDFISQGNMQVCFVPLRGQFGWK